jgi:DNA-binding HxlR family transcriptional regulator
MATENDRSVLPQLRPPMAEALRRLAGFRGSLASTSLGLTDKSRSVTLARLERAGLAERAGEKQTGRRPLGMWRATPRGRLLMALVKRWEAGA